MLKAIRRYFLRRKPFPSEWQNCLSRNVPIINRLPESDRNELCDLIKIFVAEKNFEGCAGFTITNDVKVTIAAQACLLLLHRRTDVYPALYSVLVYPNMFSVPDYESDETGIVSEDIEDRLGESWAHGAVVLSWEDVIKGAIKIDDGHNLVLHEFAHQLDDENGLAGDGSVKLKKRSMYKPWAIILGREYTSLRRQVSQGKRTFLDSYGSESPAEFFAVCTEFFFERPAEFLQKHPELYNELKLFYQQDPAGWR